MQFDRGMQREPRTLHLDLLFDKVPRPMGVVVQVRVVRQVLGKLTESLA